MIVTWDSNVIGIHALHPSFVADDGNGYDYRINMCFAMTQGDGTCPQSDRAAVSKYRAWKYICENQIIILSYNRKIDVYT